ncbi:MAG TPA: chorismate synthase [Thermodesulfovibrionales bacterium]|nr:chorismate synthase [Thermodesulfovibrionales bacterium]
MSRLRFLTAGESHGKALIGIMDGMPANLSLSPPDIDNELRRRQSGFGRGGRMKIESDHAEILSGVRWGKTLGSPIALSIENKDHKNWLEGMSPDSRHMGSIPAVTRPRPGHADLAGVIKYRQQDVRNILERSSARETAMRVALGAVAKKFLTVLGITVGSYVIQIGGQRSEVKSHELEEKELLEVFNRAEASPVRCPDEDASSEMVQFIENAIRAGNSLGGVFEVFATGLPVGLGSHIQWDERLDGKISGALMSIQAIKGVEIGLGFEMAESPGSVVMDEIFYQGEKTGFHRKTNNAGGIEGGMTNGMPVIIRAGMKPIPTLRKPLSSADIISKEPFEAAYERSDVCAVPAASVIGEAMMALVIADVFLEKFGGDSMEEVIGNYKAYLEYVKSF